MDATETSDPKAGYISSFIVTILTFCGHLKILSGL